MVARCLDPQSDDRFELVLKRRRAGKSWTKSVNNAAIAKAVEKYRRAFGNKHGSLKKAVKETARELGISQPVVRKAIRSK